MGLVYVARTRSVSLNIPSWTSIASGAVDTVDTECDVSARRLGWLGSISSI